MGNFGNHPYAYFFLVWAALIGKSNFYKDFYCALPDYTSRVESRAMTDLMF